MISETLKEYIDSNLIEAIDWTDRLVTVKDVGKFFVISEKEGERIFAEELVDGKLALIISEEELELIEDDESIDYLLFKFGNRWYYTENMLISKLVEFKYLGKATSKTGIVMPHLGVHGGFDLCNGSRVYKDWCKKAKFLGIEVLGICEENTLAGTLSFQMACDKAGIKGIIGETVKVKKDKEEAYFIKLYVESEKGWKNLININSCINVHHEGFVLEEEVSQYNEGLICVLTPEVNLHKKLAFYRKHFSKLFYQFDISQWDSNERDQMWLNNLKNYLEDYFPKGYLPPLLLSDSYFLDKEDYAIRKDLNVMGKVSFKNSSKDQYFKSTDEIILQLNTLFKEGDERFAKLVEASGVGFNMFKDIDFKIPIGKLHLPQYEISEDQRRFLSNQHLGQTNEDLFWALIQKGLEEKVIQAGLDVDIYVDRIEKETAVIIKGGFISYFLILWDIQNFCKERGIWTGIGRGSAAGCLVSYLFGIVKVDPIKYDLLFERFLNESRITKGLPDIDTDFQGSRRDEVKKYIEQKYGIDYVTSIGTYGTFKIKAAVKDLARRVGANYQVTNYISGMLEEDFDFTDLFTQALQVKQLKEYVQEYPELIEKLPLLLSQPKNASIHAAGVVIVPKTGGKIHDQMPVRMSDGMLVSEWEGEYIDYAGFLKCDILGIKQLDKFAEIAALIEKHYSKRVTFDEIEVTDDEEVLSLFAEGLNEDVFQFGAAGLKGYTKQLKPESIEDLIATVALYRPGPIDIGAHMKYIKLKNGEEEPEYDFGTEEITKNTYGIYCYQEQIMKIVQEVGGLTLVEADEVRKAMGKKLADLMEKYSNIYVEGAIKKGATEEEARKMWGKMEGFAGYAFNRSHATCYAITGYYCQWYKVHYPLEFWTVSMRYAREEKGERVSRMIEMQKTSDIVVAPVDINKSSMLYEADPETQKIYWAITSVKYVGESAVADIMKDRQENGIYFSIEEFCERTKDFRAVNKRVIQNLILAGAFDEVENVRRLQDRLKILQKFHKFIKSKSTEDLVQYAKWEEYHWILKQKDLTGHGDIDFDKIIAETGFAKKARRRIDLIEIQSREASYDEVIVAGFVINVNQKTTKGGKAYVNLTIRDSREVVQVTIWNESFEKYKETILQSSDKIIILSGRIVEFRGVKQIQSTPTTRIETLGEGSVKLTDGFTVKEVGTSWNETNDGKSLYRKVFFYDSEDEVFEWVQRADFNITEEFRAGQKWIGFIAYSGNTLNHTDQLKLIINN